MQGEEEETTVEPVPLPAVGRRMAADPLLEAMAVAMADSRLPLRPPLSAGLAVVEAMAACSRHDPAFPRDRLEPAGVAEAEREARLRPAKKAGLAAQGAAERG